MRKIIWSYVLMLLALLSTVPYWAGMFVPWVNVSLLFVGVACWVSSAYLAKGIFR